MSHNIVEINLAAVRMNYAAIQNAAGASVSVMAMVKSDAYGHGLVPVARAIASEGGRFFGVAETDEGIALREAGIKGEIIVLFCGENYHEILDYNLTPVVYDSEKLTGLSQAAKKRGQTVGVHLKIDVGMGRLGIMPGQIETYLRFCDTLPGVYLAGIMGHFPEADDVEATEKTQKQCELFVKLTAGYENLHIANSAAIFNYPDSMLSMVRPGISLYGCYPSPEKECQERIQLTPVMSFKTRVVQIKDVPSGYGLSYGHLYTTERPTRLAVLPVGYANGYLRGLTGKAEVLIKGQRAPVCGRICMNACVVDITDIPGVNVDDEVVLMGAQACHDSTQEEGVILADEVAGWLDTISYEVLCLFGRRNHRVYTERPPASS